MQKVIDIDGKKVGFRASALTPRLYRVRVGRDMIVDMNRLKKSYDKVGEDEDARLSVTDLTIFENAAFVMAKHYDNNIPDTPEEWLDGFVMFSIYEVLPHILELWNLNQVTTSTPKKK